MTFEDGAHHSILKSDELHQQLWVFNVVVLWAKIRRTTQAFFKYCVLEMQKLRCVLVMIIVEVALGHTLLLILLEHTQWLICLWLAWALILWGVFQLFQFAENLVYLLLPFVFCDCAIDHCDCALAVDEVTGAGAPARLTLDTVPWLLKIWLDEFKAV